MVGLAWSTTFGTWEPKLGGTGTRGMGRGGQDGSGQAEGHGGTATRGRAKRRESSSFRYGGFVGDAITLDCSRGSRRCEVKRCLSVIDRPTLDSGPPRFRLGPADRPTAARSASRKALGSDRPTDRPSRAARAQRGRVGTGRPTDRRQFDSVIPSRTRHSLL